MRNRRRSFFGLSAKPVISLLLMSISLASVAADPTQREEYTPSWTDGRANPNQIPESLCNLTKEIISYTCTLVNGKIASVCASRDLAPGSDGPGYIAYRYGLPGKVELAYPEKLQPPSNLFFYSGMWSHYEAQVSLSFARKPYIYTVFNHSYFKTNKRVSRSGKWAHRTGVSVRAGKTIVFQKMCKGNIFFTTFRSFSDGVLVSHLGTLFLFQGLNLPADDFVDRTIKDEYSK